MGISIVINKKKCEQILKTGNNNGKGMYSKEEEKTGRNAAKKG